MQRYDKNKKIHNLFLGNDSIKIEEYFNALNFCILSRCDSSCSPFDLSNFRESFLYKMFKKEIDLDSNSLVISINGTAHINLSTINNFFIKNKTWVSLAHRVKTNFPNKKICSIYLLNVKKDRSFYKTYPDEIKYILKNTKPNKYYLINLDYKDSPFKNLLGKYTHIVVY